MKTESISGGRSGSYAFAVRLIPGLQLLLDSIVLLLSGYGLYNSLVNYSYKTADFYNATILISWLLTITLFYFGGLYQFDSLIKFSRSADRILIAVFTTFVFMVSLGFAVKLTALFSRVWVMAFVLTSLTGLLLARLSVALVLQRLGKDRIIARNLAVYGTGVQLQNLLDHFDRSTPSFMNVLGVYTDDELRPSTKNPDLKPLGNLESLITRVRQNEIDDIVLALPWADRYAADRIMQRLRELPTNVYLCTDSIGFHIPLRQPPSYFQKLPFYELIGKPLSGWDIIIKSAEDYVLGFLLLVLCLPIFLVTAIAIKLTSPGPVLFKQRRFGFNNKPFEIYKFRSMTVQPADAGKTVQATRSDSRVTTVGRFLRRTSIDELPQLFNVLNGTMSLVGPRPHAIDHNLEYAQKISGYFARHRVKPGITGLAQIRGYRGETDRLEKMEGRVKSDIEYADNWSLMLDLKILAWTAITVLGGRNAY